MSAPVPRQNPYAAFNFKVEKTSGTFTNPNTGGSTSSTTTTSTPTEIAGFMEASGLDGENAVIEYREGNWQKTAGTATGGAGGTTGTGGGSAGAFVTKFAGLEKYPNVTLRRGITATTELWTLRQQLRDHTQSPNFGQAMDLIITLQNEKQAAVLQWRLWNAWVCKISGPSLNAKSNEIAVEAVEICCDRIEILTQ